MRASIPSSSTIQFPLEPSLHHVGLSPSDRTQATAHASHAAHAKTHAAPSLLVSGGKVKRKAPSDPPHEPFGSPIRNSPAANGSTHAPSPHTQRPPLLKSIPENAASPAAFSTPDDEGDVGAFQPKRRALSAGPGQAARHPWWSKPPVQQQQQSQRENQAPPSLYVSPWSKATGPSAELRPSAAAASPKPSSGLELALVEPAQSRTGGGGGSWNDGQAQPSQRQRLTRPITKPLKMTGLGPLFKR